VKLIDVVDEKSTTRGSIDEMGITEMNYTTTDAFSAREITLSSMFVTSSKVAFVDVSIVPGISNEISSIDKVWIEYSKVDESL